MGHDDRCTVRLFAALRDAAGTSEVQVDAPIRLDVLLQTLSAQLGERFAARLGLAAVMVDGTPVDRDSDVMVPAGVEVALLPPFAGGAG